MGELKLSTLSILLGLGFCLPQVFGLMNPKGFAAAARGFPRSLPVGYFLMILGTVWFLFNVNAEAASDFAAYKDKLMIFFAAIGLGTCIFVRDFLAVRGLAVVLLLLAKLMVDTARWEATGWRLVIIVWAYLLVAVGMWFTVSPWRLRDFLQWATANEKRLKAGCAARLAFGLFVVVLGLTAFRSAEARQLQESSDAPALDGLLWPGYDKDLRSVDFPICRIADFQSSCAGNPGAGRDGGTLADWKPALHRGQMRCFLPSGIFLETIQSPPGNTVRRLCPKSDSTTEPIG